MAKVMCRYQPSHFRTSYWSRPTSPLASLEAFLYGPPRPGHPHQFLQVGPGWNKTHVVSQLIRFGDTAPDQQPVAPARLPQWAYIQGGPIVYPRAFGAVASTAPHQAGFLNLRR